EEGMNAINLPLSPIPFELDPEDTMLEENEVRTMVDPNSRSDPKLQELIKVLIDWINDVLVGERIIVKDLAEDLYDGQVLQKLFGWCKYAEGWNVVMSKLTSGNGYRTVQHHPCRPKPGIKYSQESRYAESHLGSRIWTWNPGSHADDIMAQGLNPEMSKMPRQGALGQRSVQNTLDKDLAAAQASMKAFQSGYRNVFGEEDREKLESEKLNVAEVTQSEIAQKQKLQTVLEKINETLKLPPRSIKWNVDTVHAKSLVAILHLLVALSQYFRAPIRLPDHVSIQVVVVQKREGILQSRQIQEEITGNTEALSGRHERDAFDTLFDHAPDKLNVVKKTLITFVNKHLNKLNLEVTELETQFADGVYLVLLMGLLEGYFVPLHSFFLTPDSFEQKVLNVSFAFELMQDGGLEKPKPRPEGTLLFPGLVTIGKTLPCTQVFRAQSKAHV
ncbi:hypothetical protein EI555_005481, partial [Monodon monoceros]